MRGNLENAVILHSRKYKESSLLLTLWLQSHGKVSAVARVSKTKRTAFLYEPFCLLNVEIKLAHSAEALSTIKYVELEKSYTLGSYLSQLSRLYLNELLYWLLPFDHHDKKLFDCYLAVISGLMTDEVAPLLRYFELQLLESIGYGFSYQFDEKDNPIDPNGYYEMSALSAFYQTTPGNGVLGKTILKLGEPVSCWNNKELAVLQKLIRLNLDACLHGRALKTRELLISYLHGCKSR